jgi:hypothetical protein
MSELTRPLPAGRPQIGFASVLVLALAASFIAWVLVERNEPASPAAPAAPAAPAVAPQSDVSRAAAVPRITTVDGLSAIAGLRGGPVYWAGPRAGAVFEVTELDGRVYVRYLQSAGQLGSPRPDFLTVATYPSADAFADIEAAAKRPGAITIELPDGLAVYDPAVPTSVYLAYRGSTQQIELYSPSAPEARRLVASGLVRPVP